MLNINEIEINYKNLYFINKHFMTRLRLLDNNGSANKLQRKILVVKLLNKIKFSFLMIHMSSNCNWVVLVMTKNLGS
jgi:hypothetical protein